MRLLGPGGVSSSLREKVKQKVKHTEHTQGVCKANINLLPPPREKFVFLNREGGRGLRLKQALRLKRDFDLYFENR